MARPADNVRAAVYADAFTAMLWGLRATWQTRIAEIERLDVLLRRGERLIGCFWHGDYIPLFILMRNHDATVFTSASFRGQVISRLCSHFGYRSAMIPERGEEAYEQMKKAAAGEQFVAVATDGPLGPHHVPKRGAISLASELGMAMLPISVAASSSWIDSTRWDQRTIPRPFSRVSIAVGEPMRVPSELDQDEIPAWQRSLRQELEATDRRAEGLLEG